MRRTVRTTVTLLLLTAATALPALAGLHYESTTRTEGQGGGTTAVEGWVSGEKAKVMFRESSSPMTGKGTYLLTRDGGKTVYLIDPGEKTYAAWDIEAMLGMAGAMMTGMGPLFKMEFSTPSVEKLLDEDGGSVAGHPTRHTKYRTSYTMTVKVMGMGNVSDVVSEQDFWTTDRLQDIGLGIWLRASPRTGNADLDKVIAAEMGKLTGFPLKTVTVATAKNKKGKETVTRTTMEVTKLESADVPEATFAMPQGYTETQLLPPGMPGSSR